jgi:hypothetical protein
VLFDNYACQVQPRVMHDRGYMLPVRNVWKTVSAGGAHAQAAPAPESTSLPG